MLNRAGRDGRSSVGGFFFPSWMRRPTKAVVDAVGFLEGKATPISAQIVTGRLAASNDVANYRLIGESRQVEPTMSRSRRQAPSIRGRAERCCRRRCRRKYAILYVWFGGGGADSSVKAVEAEVEVWLLNARCGGHSQRSSVPMPQCPGAFPPASVGVPGAMSRKQSTRERQGICPLFKSGSQWLSVAHVRATQSGARGSVGSGLTACLTLLQRARRCSRRATSNWLVSSNTY